MATKLMVKTHCIGLKSILEEEEEGGGGGGRRRRRRRRRSFPAQYVPKSDFFQLKIQPHCDL
jgi:hypothetical protein